MFNDFMQYINKFMTKEEIVFALFGLVFLIVIWIAGGKYEKEQKKEKKGE